MVFQVNVTRFSGDDEDILEDDEPDLDTVMIQHPGAVNRIRVRRAKGLCVPPSLCLSVTPFSVTV